MRKNTYFPEEYKTKYSQILGQEWDLFFETIKRKQPKSFWVNTNKANVETIRNSLKEKQVAFESYEFSHQAFKIEMEKPGDLEEFKEGKISLQEKASMLPIVALAPKKTDYVLDACAAPGGKTIQLSNYAGKVLATDVNTKRIKALLHNKTKYKMENVEVKRTDFRNLLNVEEKFDKILLDAPCSSEGLVRKNREALLHWTQNLVEKKAEAQKDMIVKAFDLLKENGEMVYSTCSFAPEENEEVVLHLLANKKNAEVIPVKLEGIKIRDNELCENCVRLYPQDNDTQQFFLAKIIKLID